MKIKFNDFKRKNGFQIIYESNVRIHSQNKIKIAGSKEKEKKLMWLL